MLDQAGSFEFSSSFKVLFANQISEFDCSEFLIIIFFICMAEGETEEFTQ